MSDWDYTNPKASAAPWSNAWLEATAEIARLTDDRDKAWDRIDQLTHLLLLAHECIRHGFMDGQWATIVQTQKELLPSLAVMESKNAEVVINAIEKALRPKEEA